MRTLGLVPWLACLCCLAWPLERAPEFRPVVAVMATVVPTAAILGPAQSRDEFVSLAVPGMLSVMQFTLAVLHGDAADDDVALPWHVLFWLAGSQMLVFQLIVGPDDSY